MPGGRRRSRAGLKIFLLCDFLVHSSTSLPPRRGHNSPLSLTGMLRFSLKQLDYKFLSGRSYVLLLQKFLHRHRHYLVLNFNCSEKQMSRLEPSELKRPPCVGGNGPSPPTPDITDSQHSGQPGYIRNLFQASPGGTECEREASAEARSQGSLGKKRLSARIPDKDVPAPRGSLGYYTLGLHHKSPAAQASLPWTQKQFGDGAGIRGFFS
ncbi:uncharacterized protein LOC123929902 isoform X2 [Meles meles]|uniref:uncharacterized protein LOC123929902 isoform X2 n=1 Tax=Meles meles TaxID=9662 RepID=UPI001E69EED3|nr:uncharacterized protein LOC123929902 isoform X2 [Meles meles]